MAECIVARTPAEKRALARRLESDFPELLQWFRLFAAAFGPAREVIVEIGPDEELRPEIKAPDRVGVGDVD